MLRLFFVRFAEQSKALHSGQYFVLSTFFWAKM